MLYEMITGRPPFLGDDSVAIIGQHISTPPVAPTWHNGQCPRPLEALILRLLAKDPSERPESATDVLAALEGIDLTTSVAQPAAAVDEGHALDSLAGGVFVGRQREMGDLKAALEDVLSGRGRMVTLAGEPGIGKSRTAQELATYTGLRGAQVLWGRCYEEQGAPPYWPWVQAIRSYVREKESEELRTEMGAGAEDIAEIVSDVRERLPGLRTPLALEPEQARFRLFDSITAVLKSASRRQPLVLVLDDLHWADQPSLRLLEFVARELAGSRLLLVGTYRDMELSRRHPLALTLGELTRERLFQRVLLRGLSQEDVGRFIELVSGITPPRGTVEAVHTKTEGNPLFVTEIVRLLVQEREFAGHPSTGSERTGERESWTVRIPEGVREVIGRRLDRLTQRCNETLTIASVIGREFTLAQLKPLIEDMTEDRLLEVVEEALASRVIEELPRSVGIYQFTHGLIQETLSEELSTTRRGRLHARIAEALEELYSDDIEAHAAELAYHYAEAQAVLGTEKLVHYSLIAGERALATYAYEEAHNHCQRGLEAKGVSITGAEPPGDAEAAALLVGLVRAQLSLLERAQTAEVINNKRRAFEYYWSIGDVARAVDVVGYGLSRWGEVSAIVRELGKQLEQALTLVPPDSPAAARLLSWQGYGVAVNEDYLRGQEMLERALAIARREKDAALELLALASAAGAAFQTLRSRESADRHQRVIEAAQSAGVLASEASARYYAGVGLLITGDLAGLRQQAEAMLAAAESLRTRVMLGDALFLSEASYRVEGNWRMAREFNERGLALSRREGRLLAGRALMEYEVGDPGQADTYLDRLLEAHPLSSLPDVEQGMAVNIIGLAAHITGATERLNVAVEASHQFLSSHLAVNPRQASWRRTALALAAAHRGDADMAKEQYDSLKQVEGPMISLFVVNDRMLGLLAYTTDNLDQAVTHFEDALAFCRMAGYRPELAWTCCDYADALRERNGPDDRPRAITLLGEALAISSELGMRPLMERVLSRREIMGA